MKKECTILSSLLFNFSGQYLFAACLFFLSSNLLAQDISGEYFMNANGHTFKLEVAQDGDLLSGKMYNISNTKSPAQVSTISGKILDGKVTFERKNILTTIPQEYEAYLFTYTSKSSVIYSGMAGMFSDMGQKVYKWYAFREN